MKTGENIAISNMIRHLCSLLVASHWKTMTLRFSSFICLAGFSPLPRHWNSLVLCEIEGGDCIL